MPIVVAVLLSLAATATPVEPLSESLSDDAPIHLGVAFKLEDADGLQRLLTALQDPSSGSYHAWLTPETFGARFGLSEAAYSNAVAWFKAQGFEVTPYPNRLFLEAVGRADTVRKAFGVSLRSATQRGRQYRTFDGSLKLPPSFGAKVMHIAGLDTRLHLRHHRVDPADHLEAHIDADFDDGGVLGADDLRLEYDFTSLVANGHGAAGLTTVVLGTQEGTTRGNANNCGNGNPGPPLIPPSTTAIQAYFTNISDATATYNPIVMTDTNDFDYCGSNEEYQLDVQMQSVGAPNASQIDLLLAPASEVFQTGAQYIVNMLSTAAVVSTSLGLCESEEEQGGGGGPTTSGSEMQVMQQAIQQGLAEGQTWFAAAGDEGADDCNDDDSGTGNGFGGGNATVDFPGSMPEVVDLGGTQFNGIGSWDANGNLLAFVPEVTWNEGESLPVDYEGGAGGGGQSLYYSKPAYQTGIGPESSDGARDVPDLSLTAASSTPGVAVYDCGTGQDQTCAGYTTGAGPLDVYGGTSVAAPLAAGIFALVSGQVGCRLGDIHAELYTLGQAQQSGGAQVFHDITSGNNTFVDPNNLTITGFTAGPGFDLATGWGALDVAVLVSSWPSCGSSTTTTSSSTGTTSAASGTTSAAASTSGSASSTSAGTIGSHSTAAAASTSSSATNAATGAASSSGGKGTASGASTGSSAGSSAATGSTTGTTTGSGGGCSCGTGSVGGSLLPLLGLVALRRRRAR